MANERPLKPPQTPASLFAWMASALVILLMVIMAAVVGSYGWTIHSVNQERQQRIEQRVPACILARSLIAHVRDEAEKRTDMALYDATGCPVFLKDAGRQ